MHGEKENLSLPIPGQDRAVQWLSLYAVTEGNKHFFRSCFFFLTLSRTACQLQRDVKTIPSALVTEWPCYGPWSAIKLCSGQEHNPTWWLTECVLHVYVTQEHNRLSRPYRKAAKLVQKRLSDNKHRLQFINSFNIHITDKPNECGKSQCSISFAVWTFNLYSNLNSLHFFCYKILMRCVLNKSIKCHLAEIYFNTMIFIEGKLNWLT